MAKKSRLKADPNQYHLPGVDPDLQEKFDFAKPPALPTKKTDSSAAPANLGKAVKVRVPDFSVANRPKTCLEVDFPIPQINELSSLEGNAGKPIYQMSKWWARRRSSVFRAMLIAAAMEAPSLIDEQGHVILDENGVPVPDREQVAGMIWDHYYANHQKAGNFTGLKVLDCFMGGGTTLVEGSRLGFQVAGVDLNPVAWFVVKNELACTDPREVSKLFDKIEAEVKPAIQPFYVTECPRGHVGRWFRISEPNETGQHDPSKDELMPDDFDPITLSPKDRKAYRYDGPEVIYTFWAKHGQCTKPGCGHRTPVFRTPVMAEKKLGVKYIALTCKESGCKTAFHAELGEARMAPAAERVVLDTEEPFTALSQPFAQRLLDYDKGVKEDKVLRTAELVEMVDDEPGLCCPRCGKFAGQFVRDVLNAHKAATRLADRTKKSLRILPPRNGVKPVYSYLLVDPTWIKGSRGFDGQEELGGHPDASVEATTQWYEERLENLKLIEVRGRIKLAEDTSALAADAEALPELDDEEDETSEDGDDADDADRKSFGLPRFIVMPDGRKIDTRKGTIPKKSHFTCGKCGKTQHLNEATEESKHAACLAAYAVHCYCATCNEHQHVYSGRSFVHSRLLDNRRLILAEREWEDRRANDLKDQWPIEELPETYMTHHANFALPRQGYTHWWKMFNTRQLLLHSSILKAITQSSQFNASVQDQVIGGFLQSLNFVNSLVSFNVQRDHNNQLFANNNFRPKDTPVDVAPFGQFGNGNFYSGRGNVCSGLEWAKKPWEVAPKKVRDQTGEKRFALEDALGKCTSELHCSSSSDLSYLESKAFDLVITDPPFGDNVFYSDLSNFFYAWLRLPMLSRRPDLFTQTQTPNALEALAPRLLPATEANDHYRLRLTACWSEACRVLKDSGIMAFTFHHSEDSQWAIVLDSLFDAGFLLEQTFPIASDEQKGKGGQFGAKGTEHDIIHVCRKRLEDPTPVSWPKMRQWVKAELARLKPLLAAYKKRQLSTADIRLILRGKALEFYSKHYGQVFAIGGDGQRESLTIQTALAGINQLLDEDSDDAAILPPSTIHPVAYAYLRLFGTKPKMTAENVKKSLYSTTIKQRDLEDRGWVRQQGREVHAIPILDRFEVARNRPRKEMKTELDQAQFLIGGVISKEVDLEAELTKDTWMVSPYVAAVLDWYGKFSPDTRVAESAKLASEILHRTKEKLREKVEFVDRQQKLFDTEGDAW